MSFFDEGGGSHSDFVVEAFLAYGLLWYVLPSGPVDGLHPYVFSVSILIANGVRFAFSPPYLDGFVSDTTPQ